MLNCAQREHVVLEVDRAQHVADPPLRDADLRAVIAGPRGAAPPPAESSTGSAWYVPK